MRKIYEEPRIYVTDVFAEDVITESPMAGTPEANDGTFGDVFD